MSRLKPYPAYYQVNYDYVSQLPEGWKLLPNIAIFQERKEKGSIDETPLSVSAIKGIIKSSDYEDRKDRTSEDKSEYLIVHKGDIPYNTMLMWAGAIGYSQFRGIVSPAYTVLKPKNGAEINTKFFHYMFRTQFYKDYAKRYSYGIVDSRLRLYYTYFKRMYSIVPPLSTQNAIVSYLDRKTKQIQEFIQKKERLIELLEEKRKTEIFKLTCKGLYSSIELKDTGTSWFGKIPKHWGFIKLKFFADFVSRGSSPEYVAENGIPVVSQAVFSAGFIDKEKFKFQKNERIDKFKGQLFPDDILIASTGGGVLGKSFLFQLKGGFIADGHVTIIRDSKKRFYPEFLYYIFSINFQLIEGFLGQGSTNQTELQREWLRDTSFPVPAFNEQKEIANKIRELNIETDNIISKSQIEIEKAKEYQESLITQVVTGQLKVPELERETLTL